MRGITSAPVWLEEARKMLSEGASNRAVARKFDVTVTMVRYWTVPELRERHKMFAKAWRANNPERLAEGKARWRKANIECSRKNARKGYIRECARKEAKETGEDVYAIYERWGVLSAHDVRPIRPK